MLVVDDLDTLANDLNHGLDGLLKLLPPQQKRTRDGGAKHVAAAAQPRRRVICVCVATNRHKSDKRLLDLYRRCVEIRVRPPSVWDPHRGAATVPPAVAERTLYPLVHDLLTRPMDAASATTSSCSSAAVAAGLSEPDRVTVGLLFHENVHDYCGAYASDATLAAIAHDHATADAIGTLAHQAQTWHLWELCYLLRTFRGNLRLFPPGGGGDDSSAATARDKRNVPAAPSFTKLLTRCSTEVGTRAFLTDMCFRLGCTWHELFPRLAQLDLEYTALVSRPTPPVVLACLRQAGGGARRTTPTAQKGAVVQPPPPPTSSPPLKTTAIARTEWLHRRLSAQLVVSRQARYTPELALSEVRRMYRCLRAESGSVAASSKKRSAAAATRRAAPPSNKRPRREEEAEEEEAEEEVVVVVDDDDDEAAAAAEEEEEEEVEEEEEGGELEDEN